MKKLIAILFLASLCAIGSAQSLFRPVPDNLFKQYKDKGLNLTEKPQVWLWRLSATVTAIEMTYNKETKQFDSQPLSSAGPAIGFRHYTELPSGEPYNDFGVNLAMLLGTDINHVSPANIKPALLINAFQFLNFGVDYGIGSKTFGILAGASINF